MCSYLVATAGFWQDLIMSGTGGAAVRLCMKSFSSPNMYTAREGSITTDEPEILGCVGCTNVVACGGWLSNSSH